jgi:hypothetical protein
MKTNFVLFLFALLILSCDYWGDYEYKIQNDSQKDIQVKIFVDYWYPDEVEQDSFNINPSRTQLIRVTPSENLGRNEDPEGIYDEEINALGDLIIYSDGQRIDKNFNDIKYWTYEVTGDKVGTYTMIINDIILTEID